MKEPSLWAYLWLFCLWLLNAGIVIKSWYPTYKFGDSNCDPVLHTTKTSESSEMVSVFLISWALPNPMQFRLLIFLTWFPWDSSVPLKKALKVKEQLYTIGFIHFQLQYSLLYFNIDLNWWKYLPILAQGESKLENTIGILIWNHIFMLTETISSQRQPDLNNVAV